MAKNENPWDDAQDAELTRLWNSGMLGSKIGEAMKRTKNSILGRARRIGLKSRPSPINHGAGKPGVAHRLRTGERTLPPFAAGPRVRKPRTRTIKPATACPPPAKLLNTRATAAPAPPVPRAAPCPATGPRLPVERHECRWPMWADQERPTHRYCCAPVAKVGDPYCAAHKAVAWPRNSYFARAGKVSDATAYS